MAGRVGSILQLVGRLVRFPVSYRKSPKITWSQLSINSVLIPSLIWLKNWVRFIASPRIWISFCLKLGVPLSWFISYLRPYPRVIDNESVDNFLNLSFGSSIFFFLDYINMRRFSIISIYEHENCSNSLYAYMRVVVITYLCAWELH